MTVAQAFAADVSFYADLAAREIGNLSLDADEILALDADPDSADVINLSADCGLVNNGEHPTPEMAQGIARALRAMQAALRMAA